MDAADLAALGATSCGIWTRTEALTVATRGEVDGFVRRRAWRSVWPGVLTDAGTTLDHWQRAHAAVLACGPGAVAAGRTAARLHGLPLVDDHDPATGAREHLLDDAVSRGPRGVLRVRDEDGEVRVLRRCAAALSDDDVVRTRTGLPLTSPLRTLVDCAGLLGHEALVCALDRALHVHLVDEADLRRAVEDRSHHRHVERLREAVALTDRRAESPAETLARLALLPTMPGFVPQHRLRRPDGRVLARYDLGDEALRLAVEADGKEGHAGEAMVAKDRRRDRVSELHGWRTERVTWWELRCRRPAFVARVAQVAAERRGRP